MPFEKYSDYRKKLKQGNNKKYCFESSYMALYGLGMILRSLGIYKLKF